MAETFAQSCMVLFTSDDLIYRDEKVIFYLWKIIF